jgi:hypothetical protein
MAYQANVISFNDGPRLGGCVFFSSLSIEKKDQQNLKTDCSPSKAPFSHDGRNKRLNTFGRPDFPIFLQYFAKNMGDSMMCHLCERSFPCRVDGISSLIYFHKLNILK